MPHLSLIEGCLNPWMGNVSGGGAFATALFIPVWLILAALVPKAPSSVAELSKKRYERSDASRGVGLTACPIILSVCPQHVIYGGFVAVGA